jgi:hypothetical protein
VRKHTASLSLVVVEAASGDVALSVRELETGVVEAEDGAEDGAEALPLRLARDELK